MRPASLFLLTLSVLLMVSCTTSPENGNDDGSSDSADQTTQETTMQPSTMEETTAMETTMEESTMMEETTDEAASDEAASEVVIVRIAGLQYQPAQIEVSPGTTVRWVSEDVAEHNVVSEDDGGPLRSDTFREGGSYEYTFEEPGEFEYYCTIHPFMKAVVIVR